MFLFSTDRAHWRSATLRRTQLLDTREYSTFENYSCRLKIQFYII